MVHAAITVSPLRESIALEWTLLVVVGIALVHLAAPYLHEHVDRHGEQLNSLGRGLAVTYVFLHLFQEVADGKELIGRNIFVIVLAGFLLYYCVEHFVESRISMASSDPKALLLRFQFGLILLLKWIYSWLVIFALPEAIRNDGLHVIPAVLAVSLHILHDDVELAERFDNLYAHEGRYFLAMAPFAGWLSDLYVFQDDHMLSSVLTAVLAGSVLYTTFGGELDNHRKSHIWSFLAGVLLFLLLYFLAASR